MDIKEVAYPAFMRLAPDAQTLADTRARELPAVVPAQGAQALLPANELSAREAGEFGRGFGKALDTAVEKIQEFVNTSSSEIKFSIDEDSGRTVVRVVDRETQDVIRQIPSQEVLDLAQALGKLQGLLIRQKA